MTSAARRNFLTDNILGALLAALNTPVTTCVLSSIMQDVDNSNDVLPNVLYGLIEEATPKEGDDKKIVPRGTSRFAVWCYYHGVTDAAQSGVNRRAINLIIAAVESAINNQAIDADPTWQDAEGITGEVFDIYTTDISSVPDFGDPLSVFAVNGIIEWGTGYDAS